ncbi:MAG: sensor histidine kinase [Clostridiales Family XIII bacterium]|nr:sensor histidine kinase [Clostridiales Family XIII bacterium]
MRAETELQTGGKASRISGLKGFYRGKSIQFTISLSFTAIMIGCMILISILMYSQFRDSVRETTIRENRNILDQVALNVSQYTKQMMRISDTVYYNVIKNTDVSNPQDTTLIRNMNLMYESNNDSLVSIACFSESGELIVATPNALIKKGIDVKEQDWFINAGTAVENVHFSEPHISNIFEDSSQPYRWVISLSRVVELTSDRNTSRGVLLVDMDYSSISQAFPQFDARSDMSLYLMDVSGELIYHPKEDLIFSGLYRENNRAAMKYADGVHKETFEGQGRTVIVKTAGYTGWRLVIVIPDSAFGIGVNRMNLLVFPIIALSLFIIVAANLFVSSRVAQPIKRLEASVHALDEGDLNPDIYVGGPHEIEHLGATIKTLVGKMRDLMDRVVNEQEDKRRSEFDALQAQINPHFLYNTMDSIVWMIEEGRQREAISMITSFASLFRISLSKGRNIIPIRSELDHARYYLHIQNIRYRNKFRVVTDIDPCILESRTIKLIIQPLLENAIYHAMEVLDGDGIIEIRGYRCDDDVCIEVRDNGYGMSQEKAESLLHGNRESEKKDTNKKGSGIGVRNVHERIRVYFGENYGLEIESTLDVGTTCRIRLPYLRYDGEEAEL